MNKIAKENLQVLPLPQISNEDDAYIKELVIRVIETGDDVFLQDYINKNIFGLSDKEIKCIKAIG